MAFFCEKTGVRIAGPGVSKAIDPENGHDEVRERPAPAERKTSKNELEREAQELEDYRKRLVAARDELEAQGRTAEAEIAAARDQIAKDRAELDAAREELVKLAAAEVAKTEPAAEGAGKQAGEGASAKSSKK